jgi:hypothetical protein
VESVEVLVLSVVVLLSLVLELDVVVVSCGSNAILTILSVSLSSISSLPTAKFSALVASEDSDDLAVAVWYVASAVSASDVLLSFTAVLTELRKVLKGSDVPLSKGAIDLID